MKKNYVILITMSLVSALLAGGVLVFLMLETNIFGVSAASPCTVTGNLTVAGNLDADEKISKDIGGGFLNTAYTTECYVRTSNWSSWDQPTATQYSPYCSSYDRALSGGGFCENDSATNPQNVFIQRSNLDTTWGMNRWVIICARDNPNMGGKIRAKAYIICCE